MDGFKKNRSSEIKILRRASTSSKKFEKVGEFSSLSFSYFFHFICFFSFFFHPSIHPSMLTFFHFFILPCHFVFYLFIYLFHYLFLIFFFFSYHFYTFFFLFFMLRVHFLSVVLHKYTKSILSLQLQKQRTKSIKKIYCFFNL